LKKKSKLNQFFKLYLLTFPFHAFGLMIGEYNFNLPTLFHILLFLVYIYTKKNLIFSKKIMPIISFFLFWCLITVYYNQLPFNWIFSFVVFILMVLPIVLSYRVNDFDQFYFYVIVGFLITVPFSLYDLCVTLLSLQPFGHDSIFFDYSVRGWVGGFYRVRATFDEPSFYAIYLCLVFYLLNNKRFPYKSIIISLLVFLLVMTLSLTGIAIFSFILAYKVINSSVSIKIKTLLAITSIIFSIIIFLPNNFQNIISRSNNAVSALLSFNTAGSEESRINSIPVLINYFNSNNSNPLIGEGYSNYQGWLINNYGSHGKSNSFARGTIHNAFGVIGISTGIIGLIIYILIFILMGINKILSWNAILFHWVIQMSYTLMVGYFFWGIVLLLIVDQKIMKSNRSYNYEIN